MNERPSHTAFHARWYRPHMSTWWWLQRPSSLLFILRELSSVFVAWFVIFWVLLLRALGQGEVAYREFLSWAARPGVLLVNLVSLLFVVFHAMTWFNLAAQAMVVQLGGRKVPGEWITAANYAAWALVSVLVAWIIGGG
jgi:fumarate reductase subunit C